MLQVYCSDADGVLVHHGEEKEECKSWLGKVSPSQLLCRGEGGLSFSAWAAVPVKKMDDPIVLISIQYQYQCWYQCC